MILESKLVDIRGLKKWARSLSIDSKLRELILLEDDYVPVDEYLGKTMVWDSLSRIEETEGTTMTKEAES